MIEAKIVTDYSRWEIKTRSGQVLPFFAKDFPDLVERYSLKFGNIREIVGLVEIGPIWY